MRSIYKLENTVLLNSHMCTVHWRDGLTQISFAGNSDGGWSPCNTLSGERAFTAVHITLDWDVI